MLALDVSLCRLPSARALILYLRRGADHGIITDKHGTENEYAARREMKEQEEKRGMRKISYLPSPELECTLLKRTVFILK